MKVAVLLGGNIPEDLNVRRAWAGFADDVEVSEGVSSVNLNVEKPRRFAAPCEIHVSVEGFGKIQAQFVDAMSQPDLVGEGPFAPAFIDARIVRLRDRVAVQMDRRAAQKESIRTPNMVEAIPVSAAGAAGENADSPAGLRNDR